MIKLLSFAVIAGFLFVEPADGQPALLEPLPPKPELPSSEPAAVLKPLPPKPELPSSEPATLFKPLPFKPVLPSSQPVCWTGWFDRDNPSGTGDWEVLSSLRKENPGKICPNPTDIEVQTLSGQSMAAAGEVIYKADTTTGFVCRNADQKDKYCKDYRVRFSCPPSYCKFEACWTPWFDRDDPSGTGDWEILSSLRKEHPNKICKTPMYIEAVVVGTNIPASSSGEIFHIFNPTEGLVCRKSDQKDKKCRDYKVRFGCCCD